MNNIHGGDDGFQSSYNNSVGHINHGNELLKCNVCLLVTSSTFIIPSLFRYTANESGVMNGISFFD